MQIYVHKTNYAIKIKIMNNINKKQKKKKMVVETRFIFNVNKSTK